MSPAITIAIVLAGAAVWAVRMAALRRLRRDATAPATDASEVSIVVPARNEAHNLPALLASLGRLDPAPGEVIVVDDHSTDGTGELARAAGARVVTPPPLPPGWLGKPWACRTGAEATRGRYLLFTDADTVHAPDSLGRALGTLRSRGAGLLSVVPTHAARATWEKLQGVFQLLLLLACRAGGRARRGERQFSIGQYLLFTRDAYLRTGGHETVRDRVAEDLAFARVACDNGDGFTLCHHSGLMTVRMYPEGFGGFVRGWRRNVREGIASAGLGGVLEMVAVIGWLLGAPLAVIGGAVTGDVALAAAGLAGTVLAAVAVAVSQREVGRLPAAAALSYPLFTLVFVAISALALVDRARSAPVRWKDRAVARHTLQQRTP